MRIVWGLVSALVLLVCTGVMFAQNIDGLGAKVIVKMNDSEVPILPTPAGKMVKANHIFTVPSGSMVCSKGNVTRVYKDGKPILTVLRLQVWKYQ